MRKSIALAVFFFFCAVFSGVCSDVSLTKTGQTAAYGTDDDGTLQKGIAWPNPRFADNGDGTVTDMLTGLMWEKSPSSLQTWAGAVTYCNDLTLGSYSDWRLPNLLELESLINEGQSSPMSWLNLQGFTGVAGYYWSSTTYAPDTASAWLVQPVNGGVDPSSKANYGYVWAVRGGQ